MLIFAALIPDTALLVPGAAGRAVVLEDTRSAAVAAVRELVGAGPDQVVVVAPGRVDRVLDGPVRPSLAAAGIAAGDVGWAGLAADDGALAPGALAPGAGASVALLVLAHVGWTGPVTVVEVAAPEGVSPGGRVDVLRGIGAGLTARTDRVGLVVAGSLSARSGPAAPHPDDARAAPLDAAVLADLALGDPAARDRLGAIPGSLATELAVTAWAPLQVLLGAAAGAPALEAELRRADAPFGVTYPVATWRLPARTDAPKDARPAARSDAGEVVR